MRILVVEDEPRLLRNLAKALREEGYAVDTAAAGDEELHKAENYDYHAGQEPLQRVPFDLAHRSLACLQLVGPLAEQRGLRIACDLQPGTVLGDADRGRQPTRARQHLHPQAARGSSLQFPVGCRASNPARTFLR